MARFFGPTIRVVGESAHNISVYPRPLSLIRERGFADSTTSSILGTMSIPGSVRLSLSLAVLHWRREREERSEGVGPWSGPTTPAVISNHPAYHIGWRSTIRFDLYLTVAGRFVPYGRKRP